MTVNNVFTLRNFVILIVVIIFLTEFVSNSEGGGISEDYTDWGVFWGFWESPVSMLIVSCFAAILGFGIYQHFKYGGKGAMRAVTGLAAASFAIVLFFAATNWLYGDQAPAFRENVRQQLANSFSASITGTTVSCTAVEHLLDSTTETIRINAPDGCNKFRPMKSVGVPLMISYNGGMPLEWESGNAPRSQTTIAYMDVRLQEPGEGLVRVLFE